MNEIHLLTHQLGEKSRAPALAVHQRIELVTLIEEHVGFEPISLVDGICERELQLVVLKAVAELLPYSDGGVQLYERVGLGDVSKLELGECEITPGLAYGVGSMTESRLQRFLCVPGSIAFAHMHVG